MMGEYSKLNRSGLVSRCINLKQQAQSARERTCLVRKELAILQNKGEDADRIAMGKALSSIGRIVSDFSGDLGEIGGVISRMVVEGFGGVELYDEERRAI